MSIVLGFDRSPGAEHALEIALETAVAFGEALIIVYGAEPPGGRGEEFASHREAILAAGHSALDAAVGAAESSGVPTAVELIEESPVAALLQAAEKHQARAIVVGTWGDSPIKGAILGSTPHKLLHLSKVPVVCVPAAD